MIFRKLLLLTALCALVLTGCGGGGGSSSQGTLSGSTDGTGLRYYYGEISALMNSIRFNELVVVLEATGEQVLAQNGTYTLKTQFNGLESVSLRFVGTASDGTQVDTAVEIPELPEDYLAIGVNVTLDTENNIGNIESFGPLLSRDEQDKLEETLPKPDKLQAQATQQEVQELMTSSSSSSESTSQMAKPASPDEREESDTSIEAKTEEEIDEYGIL